MDNLVVAIYLRLSNEDKDKAEKEESNSISAQRALITDHVAELLTDREYRVIEFCDDGYSGTNFDRPGIQALIESAKSGEINMVVVKDFSRFGRDYLEVGRFLEYIFPILQIRFVSVNDHYDSGDKYGETGGMSVAFKNLIYGLYSADLSKKVRSARDTRVKNGEFVGTLVPYGYRRNPENKHKLLIDEDAAQIVREIFELAAGGTRFTEIARILNEKGVSTRGVYRKAKGSNYQDKHPNVTKKMWNSAMISEIITDQTYLGTLIWNRARCGIDTGKKVVKQEKENWIVVKNQHEAIVSEEIFEKANSHVIRRETNRKQPGKRENLVLCGYCGRCLERKKNRYYCRNRINQLESDCQKIRVDRSSLEGVVLGQVRNMCELLLEKREINPKKAKSDRKRELEDLIEKNTKELQRCRDKKVSLYAQYKQGEIGKTDYMELLEKSRMQQAELEQKSAGARNELDELAEVHQMKEIPDEELREFAALEVFDRDKLGMVIDRVVVYGKDEIEIVWKCKNPFDE